MKRLTALLCAAAGVLAGQTPASLKDAYKGVFKIGAAVNYATFTDENKRDAAIVKAQFDSITPENVLKWMSVHPQPDRYAFDGPDRYVAFGEKNGMWIVGHTLVWHNQTPKWVFEDAEGKPLTREALLDRMRDHILTVVGRYKGRIKGWDVVNEALEEDGSLRQSPWMKIIGEDYIAKAYQWAHEADPAAELYYNDYSLQNEPKWKGAVALVGKLRAAGIPVTGIGSQDHVKMDWPTAAQMTAMFDAFRKLGVKVMITELDVDMLPQASDYRGADPSKRAEMMPKIDPYTAGLPADLREAQGKRYAELFAVYIKNRDIVSRVTLWGVADDTSWLNNWPVRGRTNHPLLFDRAGKPKPAYDAAIAAAAVR